MHPHSPCPLVPLWASQRRSMAVQILLNWLMGALQPIVMFCIPRYPRIATWIAGLVLRLVSPP
jgi:hypothetical protein